MLNLSNNEINLNKNKKIEFSPITLSCIKEINNISTGKVWEDRDSLMLMVEI